MKARLVACLIFTVGCFLALFVTVYRDFRFDDVIQSFVVITITTGFWIVLVRDFRESRDIYSSAGFLIGYRLLMRRTEYGLKVDSNHLVITKDEMLYRSPFRTEYVWKQGWNEATDWGEDYPHGLYSMRKNHLGSLKNRAYGMVVEVELAGNIEIHEKGYRSQFARVSAIIGNDELASEYFGVPMRNK